MTKQSKTYPNIERMGIVLLVIAAGAWALWPAIHGSWLWDDELELFNNLWVRDSSGWWKCWAMPQGLDYYPLKDTFNWILWHTFGNYTTGYHLINLALHIISSFLIWKILVRLEVKLAWIAALSFAIHPMVIESVAWISEFKSVVSLPLLLLSINAFISYKELEKKSSLLISVIFFTLSLLAKVSGIMLPVVFILYALNSKRTRLVKVSLIYVGIALVFGIVALFFQKQRAMLGVSLTSTLSDRLLQAGPIALLYLKSYLLPLNLSPVYDSLGWKHSSALAWVILAIIFFLGVTLTHKRYPLITLSLIWLGVHLLPVLGILPLAYSRVAPRADHLAYVSLVGFSALIALIADLLWETWAKSKKLRAVLLCIGVWLVAGVLIIDQSYAAVFNSSDLLWKIATQRAPGAWLPHNNLGRFYIQSGQLDKAYLELSRASELKPDSAEVLANLGDVFERQNRLGEAKLSYERSIALDPAFSGAHYNLGRLLLKEGNYRGAVTELTRSLELNPHSALAQNNLGLSFQKLGNLDLAIEHFDLALALDPLRYEVYLNLGNTYFRKQNIDLAIDAYRKAIDIKPDYGAAHRNLAVALFNKGLNKQAEEEFALARKLLIP